MARETLVVNAIGGLCNRMRSIATGVHLAQVSGRRLKVVWHNNSDLAADYSDLFQAIPDDMDIIYPGNVEYGLKWDIPRMRNLYVSRLYQRARFAAVFSDASGLAEYFDDDKGFCDVIASKRGDILIISGLAVGGFDDEMFRRMFIPSARVQALIDQKTAGFNSDTVGVHIRRTDNRESIRQSPLELFVTEMADRIKVNDNVNFFVASDDAVVLHELSDRFGRRVICGDDKVSRRSLEGMMQGAADLWALAKTREILGSYYSSYTDTAALLGNIPLKVLTAIQ